MKTLNDINKENLLRKAQKEKIESVKEEVGESYKLNIEIDIDNIHDEKLFNLFYKWLMMYNNKKYELNEKNGFNSVKMARNKNKIFKDFIMMFVNDNNLLCDNIENSFESYMFEDEVIEKKEKVVKVKKEKVVKTNLIEEEPISELMKLKFISKED